MTKISLCIPTKNRFDTFLSNSLGKYIDFLKNGIIDEIVISDETGDDNKKIQNKYGDVDGLKLFSNESILGVLLNKLKVCSYASHEFIALIDSDNFCDEQYFVSVKQYIKNTKDLSNYLILSPVFAKPRFNYTAFKDKIITKRNINLYRHVGMFDCLMNTGNYVLTKNITDNIKYDKDVLFYISACDVIYFNVLAFEQFADLQFHILDICYDHAVHSDSEYLKTIDICRHYSDNVLTPRYNKL